MAMDRANIYMSKGLMAKAVERAEKLGFKNFSAYIRFLVQKDTSE